MVGRTHENAAAQAPQATERKGEEWAGEQSGKMGLNVDYQAKKDGSAGASRQA